jgi:hypothetical protein
MTCIKKFRHSPYPYEETVPMTSPSDVYKPSFGQLGWRAVILALTAAFTIIVLSVVDKLFAPAEHPRAAAAIISAPAKAKSGQPVTKPIVPAMPLDPDSAAFIGTGDGSAGYWAKP